MDWQPIAAASTVVLFAGLGMLLAMLTMPGVWLMLLAAALVKWLWMPDLISVWTLVVCLVLAIAGEIIEAVASAAGASKFGGSRAGSLASIAGGLIGALMGTFLLPIPILGTVVGAVAGSALATFSAEVWYKKRTYAEGRNAAAGAAIGRTLATIVKIFISGTVALILTTSVLIESF